MTDDDRLNRLETIKRALTGALIALPQVAAWMFTASVLNLARERGDVFFSPMWLAIVLIGAVLISGAAFVRYLWQYFRAERTYAAAAASGVVAMTAAIALAFATAIVTS